VSGIPEDFTLSRLGVRYGKALLRDELLWQPILGDRLATWGTRGHIASYRIHVAHRDVVGPCVPQEVEDGLVFAGTPELRSPGLTIIGRLRVETRDDIVAATLPGRDTTLAKSVLEWANNVATAIAESINVKASRYSVAALVWDDVEPFASDKLIAFGHGIAAPLLHGNSDALHEAVHLISVHTVYNNSLGDLSDYCLYEVLPHVLALHMLALSCKAPLIFWHIAETKGSEQLAMPLSCKLATTITVDRLRKCLVEVRNQAEDHMKDYLYGRAMPS
jgi:hypothetical protein